MGFAFMNIPDHLFFQNSPDHQRMLAWAREICDRLSEGGKVIISVNITNGKESLIPSQIREIMGIVVKEIFNRVTVDDLLIEGGATASIILKYLGIKRLFPFRELEQGVIQMRVQQYPDLCITTKPGSYLWPSGLIISQDHNFELKKTSPSSACK
jgi:hypothetical protein